MASPMDLASDDQSNRPPRVLEVVLVRGTQPGPLSYTGEPMNSEQHYELTRDQAIELNSQIDGTHPVYAVHNDKFRVGVGKVLAGRVHDNGDWTATLAIETSTPAGRYVLADIDYGWLREVSLGHCREPFKINEVSICNKGARPGTVIASGFNDESKSQLRNEPRYKNRNIRAHEGTRVVPNFKDKNVVAVEHWNMATTSESSSSPSPAVNVTAAAPVPIAAAAATEITNMFGVNGRGAEPGSAALESIMSHLKGTEIPAPASTLFIGNEGKSLDAASVGVGRKTPAAPAKSAPPPPVASPVKADYHDASGSGLAPMTIETPAAAPPAASPPVAISTDPYETLQALYTSASGDPTKQSSIVSIMKEIGSLKHKAAESKAAFDNQHVVHVAEVLNAQYAKNEQYGLMEEGATEEIRRQKATEEYNRRVHASAMEMIRAQVDRARQVEAAAAAAKAAEKEREEKEYVMAFMNLAGRRTSVPPLSHRITTPAAAASPAPVQVSAALGGYPFELPLPRAPTLPGRAPAPLTHDEIWEQKTKVMAAADRRIGFGKPPHQYVYASASINARTPGANGVLPCLMDRKSHSPDIRYGREVMASSLGHFTDVQPGRALMSNRIAPMRPLTEMKYSSGIEGIGPVSTGGYSMGEFTASPGSHPVPNGLFSNNPETRKVAAAACGTGFYSTSDTPRYLRSANNTLMVNATAGTFEVRLAAHSSMPWMAYSAYDVYAGVTNDPFRAGVKHVKEYEMVNDDVRGDLMPYNSFRKNGGIPSDRWMLDRANGFPHFSAI
jgi:hypothetical protein